MIEQVYKAPTKIPVATTSHWDWSSPFVARGLGRHPAQDPWGRPFDESYYPDRFRLVGQELAGQYTFVLDGLQGDADFIAALFQLKRPLAWHTQHCFVQCHVGGLAFWVNVIFGKPTPHSKEITTPGSYRHRECCYHCSAVSYFDEDGAIDETPLLYTNWGRDAEYRREPLVAHCTAATCSPKFNQRCYMLSFVINIVLPQYFLISVNLTCTNGCKNRWLYRHWCAAGWRRRVSLWLCIPRLWPASKGSLHGEALLAFTKDLDYIIGYFSPHV